jgi:hypothetical protein
VDAGELQLELQLRVIHYTLSQRNGACSPFPPHQGVSRFVTWADAVRPPSVNGSGQHE